MTINNKVIIYGSARSNGDTRKIVDHICHEVPMDVVDLNDKNIGYYDYDHKNQSDDYLSLMEQLTSYSTLILATPVYWYTMSAPMKTFFDRLSDLVTIRKDLGRSLANKSMVSVSCSSDENLIEGFAMPFRETANYLGMNYQGHLHTWIEEDNVPAHVANRIKDFLSKI